MKRLILMRHAKSDWSGGGNDHNRPLNPRGRKAAAALGDWLRAHDLLPDQVLSSSSMRTHETFVRLDLPQDIDVIFTRALYLATHDEILKAMRNASGDTILTLGHNPGSGIAASQILASPQITLSSNSIQPVRRWWPISTSTTGKMRTGEKQSRDTL
ncbi:SixA phosphatase family protein [Sulfitobacter sediminilitoris]|uniref:SixA phosphatase family protein n=1 Tax=Sulfitobacter sediminilitoris TaxID=2698830 RepID=UPI0036221822